MPKWIAAPLLFLSLFLTAAKSNHIKLHGTLHTNVAAIGGETTGFTVTDGKKTWELEFDNNHAARKLAEKSDGKTVDVSGRLEVSEGIETGERQIVHVASLKVRR